MNKKTNSIIEIFVRKLEKNDRIKSDLDKKEIEEFIFYLLGDD
tara:strand:- start:143 stop:271 length:129 start_codon:yes stop_codon:yes gene_type:complete